MVWNGRLEQVGHKTNMHIIPAVVELSQKPANKVFHKRKVENWLGKDDQIVHFVKELIANEDEMEKNNYNWHNVANISQPTSHEDSVIGGHLTSINFVGKD